MPAVLALLACGCGGAARDDPGADGPAPRFTDVSEAGGIDLVVRSGDAGKRSITETVGQGAAALDYDHDGRLDLFVVDGGRFEGTAVVPHGPSRLFRNRGGLAFEDVSEAAALDVRVWGHGATAVDLDGDAWTDLYLTAYGPNVFLRNRGDGTFEDASGRWGGADPGPSTAAAFLDADADGDLDLYVGNFVVYDPADPPNGGQPCDWYDQRVACGPGGTIPGPDTFFENRDGRMVEATERFGFAAVEPRYALGAVTGDVDLDGDVDLFVANDSTPNFLFENDGAGGFRDVAALRGADRNQEGVEQACMGTDLGDLDGDGRPELFVTNFSQDSDTLYHNVPTAAGEAFFVDASARARLARSSYSFLSWGTRFCDLDLDGRLDLVIASGHVYPQADAIASNVTSYAQRNQLFRNVSAGPGELRFEPLELAPGDAFEARAVSRGLVAADLDDDGDADFLVVQMDACPTLIRSDGRGGHWIGLELRGSGRNTDAIGARVSVEDGLGHVRWRERSSGGSYLSSGDPRLVFGLGVAAGAVRAVTVRWPSGRETVHADLRVDRYWVLDETSGSAALRATP